MCGSKVPMCGSLIFRLIHMDMRTHRRAVRTARIALGSAAVRVIPLCLLAAIEGFERERASLSTINLCSSLHFSSKQPLTNFSLLQICCKFVFPCPNLEACSWTFTLNHAKSQVWFEIRQMRDLIVYAKTLVCCNFTSLEAGRRWSM